MSTLSGAEALLEELTAAPIPAAPMALIEVFLINSLRLSTLNPPKQVKIKHGSETNSQQFFSHSYPAPNQELVSDLCDLRILPSNKSIAKV